ncbi:MAG: helix-turn-helix transcriptional regulator [Helicobacteraceae bacterium]|jgi:DNA-binding XRE family transcriptional regulator|nr:helix-turn-helix transcriptional regulator [Helicobacteraceae bacterium]
MEIKLSLRRGAKGCEVVAAVADSEAAKSVGEAVCSFLRLSGHDVELECCEDEGCPSMALKCLRLKNNLTQGEFAEKLGAKQNVISDMERGARRISVKMAKKIEAVFGAPYHKFL